MPTLLPPHDQAAPTPGRAIVTPPAARTGSRVAFAALAAAALAAALTLVPASMGLAATPSPTPDAGPVGGGTVMSVASPARAFTVSAGDAHSLALGGDGTIYAWGHGERGENGDGSMADSSVPVEVSLPPGVIFTNVSTAGAHSVALGDDGKTYSWGFNIYGQLGIGGTVSSSVPVAVSLPSGVTFTSVAAGLFHSLAIGDDGKVYAWGYNTNGQLGDGSTVNSSVPVAVTMPSGVTFTSVSTHSLHSMAFGDDGKVYAWGYNNHGQLGDGSTVDSSVPVPMSLPSGVTFTSISAGHFHSLALGDDGKAYAWGYNLWGQLGDGSTVDSSVPVEVSVPAGVTFTTVVAGDYHSLALGDDGKTYAWGMNINGHLGNGGTAPSSVPVAVSLPSGVTFTALAAGYNHSLAMGDDGRIYAWGSGRYGDLGNGGTADSLVPVAVSMPPVLVTAVTFGGVAGTNLAYDAVADAWTADTPAHPAGTVDVVVEYTVGGVAQTPITYANAFTYLAPELAATGGEASGPLVVALFALGLGVLALLAPRERRAKRAAARARG